MTYNLCRLFLKAALVLALLAIQTSAKKSTLTIIYDSVSPDARDFFVSQLAASWRSIKKLVNVEFVPFSKNYTYTGDGCPANTPYASCILNVYHSCALSLLPSQSAQVDFLKCMAKRHNNLAMCSEEHPKVDLVKADECYDENENQILRDQIRKVAELIPYTAQFTWTSPAIILDHSYNESLSLALRRDLKNTLRLTKNMLV